jgi:hypothetical protein
MRVTLGAPGRQVSQCRDRRGQDTGTVPMQPWASIQTMLSERTGRRIDEDCPRLSTLADMVAFLTAPV